MTKKKKRTPAMKVIEQPAACPKCGGTTRTGRVAVYTSNTNGIRPDGKPYSRIRHWRAKCKTRGQSLAFLSFENVPKTPDPSDREVSEPVSTPDSPVSTIN